MRTVFTLACIVAVLGAACSDSTDTEPSVATVVSPATTSTTVMTRNTTSTTVEPGPLPFDPGTHTQPGLHDIALRGDGVARTYSLLVPATHDPSTPASLVVAFHGWTMAPDQMTRGAWGLLAEEMGFLLAAPAGVDHEWAVAHDDDDAAAALPNSTANLVQFPKGDADVAFASGVIAEITEYFLVDPSGIFVTGVSLGGFMASRVACELDGIAALGATFNSVLYSNPCPTEATPAVISVGAEFDFTHAVSDAEQAVAAWARHNGCAGGTVESQVEQRVVRTDFDECDPAARVAMIVNEHSWVGDAAERTVWEFFDSLP